MPQQDSRKKQTESDQGEQKEHDFFRVPTLLLGGHQASRTSLIHGLYIPSLDHRHPALARIQISGRGYGLYQATQLDDSLMIVHKRPSPVQWPFGQAGNIHCSAIESLQASSHYRMKMLKEQTAQCSIQKTPGSLKVQKCSDSERFHVERMFLPYPRKRSPIVCLLFTLLLNRLTQLCCPVLGSFIRCVTRT